jgi:hypothetical protein
MAILYGERLLMSYGERTSKQAADFLSDWLKIEVIP